MLALRVTRDREHLFVFVTYRDLPATIEGSLEVTLPDWKLRRRSWHRHPECPCVLPVAG